MTERRGGARVSEMGWPRGELNVGQLVRECWPGETLHRPEHPPRHRHRRRRPGRTRPHGARAAWPPRQRRGADEVGEAAYWLDLRGENPTNGLRAERLQRFTGVIYRPETERWSHDVHTRLSDMYDALLRRNERGGAAGRNGRHGKSAGEPG